jgi:hypothetical protein
VSHGRPLAELFVSLGNKAKSTLFDLCQIVQENCSKGRAAALQAPASIVFDFRPRRQHDACHMRRSSLSRPKMWRRLLKRRPEFTRYPERIGNPVCCRTVRSIRSSHGYPVAIAVGFVAEIRATLDHFTAPNRRTYRISCALRRRDNLNRTNRCTTPHTFPVALYRPKPFGGKV